MTNWTRALGIVLAVGVLSTSAFSQLGRGGGKGGGSTPPPKNQGSGGSGGGKQPPVKQPPPGNQGGGGKVGGGGSPPPRNQGGGGSGLGRGGSSGGGKGGGSTPPPRNQGGGSGGGSQSGGGKSGGGGKVDTPGGGLGRGGTQGGGPSNSGGGGLGRGGGSTQGGGIGRGGGSSSGGGTQGGGIGRGGGTGVIPRNNGGATGRGGPSSNGNGGFVNTGRPGDIGRVQLPSLNKGSIAQQAGRMNEARPNRGNWGNNGNNGNGYGYGNYNGWRCGYYQYDNRWNDNSFWYGHYTNNPWDNRCTISPWYYYSNLPAYIVVTRIVFVDNTRCDWGYGQRYNGDWNNRNTGWGNSNNGGWGNDRWDNRDRDRDGIREVVYDLRDFFERQDRRALSNLIDRDRVNIYHEGRYSYSVDGEDYYDMMLDGALATRTISYEIEDVRQSRDGIQISARHTFATPFNGRSSVMHNYRLVEGRNGWYITDFNTGYRSAW